MSAFDDVIGFTLEHEGGLSKDPDDPGGTTNFGISQRYHPKVNVEHLTREEAVAIYKREYWDAFGCAQLDWPLNAAFFESCVNPGVFWARQWKTDARSIHEFLLLKMNHYRILVQSNPTRRKFLVGWLDRTLDFFDRFAV